MARLQGKTIAVTGASSGIGRAIAERCAAEGADVVAAGRDRGRLREVAAAGGGRITTLVADLTDDGAGGVVVDAALARTGRLDGVVHAAGTVKRNEDVRETSDAEFLRVLDENLVAVLRIARPALAQMMAAGSGSVVLVGSQLAHIALPGYASYCAAKGGVTSLARALALQAGPAGVRVNVLAPGVVKTPMAYVDRPDFDAVEADVAKRHPLGRIGRPEDMAGPAVFLLSDDAAWMTGQALIVDGGFTIQ